MKKEKLDIGRIIRDGLKKEDMDKVPGYCENVPDDYKKVIYISWEEEDYFWVRPDGCSLHLTKEDADKFVEKCSDGPHGWFHPAGDPVPVYVSPDIYEKIAEQDDRTLRLNAAKESKLICERKLLFTKERSGWVKIGLGCLDKEQ